MGLREIIITAFRNVIEGEEYEYQCDNCKKVFDFHHIILTFDKRYLCVKCFSEIFPQFFVKKSGKK